MFSFTKKKETAPAAPESKEPTQSTPKSTASKGIFAKGLDLLGLSPAEEKKSSLLVDLTLKALDNVLSDCKENQEDLKSTVRILKYKYNFKTLKLTDEMIIDDLTKILKSLESSGLTVKAEKFFSSFLPKAKKLFNISNDYETFSKHISPVLEKWKEAKPRPSLKSY